MLSDAVIIDAVHVAPPSSSPKSKQLTDPDKEQKSYILFQNSTELKIHGKETDIRGVFIRADKKQILRYEEFF